MNTTQILIDILGWIGSLMLIAAYFQISRNKLDSESRTYQLLNVLGSALLVINSMYYGAYPSGTLNVIWIIIGLHFLVKYSQQHHPKEP